jgi:hypothetical protein
MKFGISWGCRGIECPVNVSEIRVPLHPIFSGELPNGYTHSEYYGFILENLNKLPRIVEFGSPQHLQRIELEAIRECILKGM